MSSMGRNEPNKNKNIEKAFSGDSLYHHEKITEAMSIGKADYDNNNNNNKNNIIPANQHPTISHKLKNSFSGSGDTRTTSPQKKENLIRISEYKIDQPLQNQDKNNKNRVNNNKDLINRLKKQSSYLKSSITNKNQISNNSKNKVLTCFQFEEKENLSMNKNIKNEKSHCHLVKGIDILSKYDTFEIDQKKNIYVDKNKFNKNSHIFNEKNKDYDMIKKIKNLKTLHPKLNNKKTISIQLNKDNLNFEKEKEKEKETNNNINTNTIITQNNIDSSNNNNGSYLIDKDKDKNKLRNISKSNLIKKSKDKIRSKDRQNSKVYDKDKDEQNNQKEITKEDEINKNKDENENDKNKVDINANHENKENFEKEKDDQERKNEKKEEIEQVNNHENKKNIKEKEKDEIERKDEKNNIKENKKKIKNNYNSNNNDNKNEKDFYFILYEGEKKEDEEEKVLYFDTSNINNVQIPKEYLNTIYYNLLEEEMTELNPKPVHTYMKTQKEINEQMRSILVDWIIDVHHKFGFTDETLFMTILIIDRYCTIENITRIKYQCLGITALMIACKHEEINVPKVEDFIYITDNAYTKEEVFQMENDVLDKLNFCLLYPSPIKFYEYLSLHFNFSKKYHMLGKYLMESFLLDLKYIKYKSSVISCACAYIVMKFFKMPNYRHSYDKKFYLVDENVNTIPNGLGVKDCAQDICVFVDNINNTNLLSCQKKYTKTEFEGVATLISNNK